MPYHSLYREKFIGLLLDCQKSVLPSLTKQLEEWAGGVVPSQVDIEHLRQAGKSLDQDLRTLGTVT
jgi:hypothetical protein